MTLPSRVERLRGWGGIPVEECRVVRPERTRELLEAAAGGTASRISRGAGRSYGDAALNRDGIVISHLRLNRLLHFDPATAVLTCEAGATVADVLDALLPRGFLLPVVPGTRIVTIGGAIACDVHGKNHLRAGSFAACVEDLVLLTPDGERRTCSRERHPELFWATVGGMGLTGAISTARLRLRRATSGAVRVDTRRCRGVEAGLAELAAAAERAEFAAAWVDAAAGPQGRVVVTSGDHVPLPARGPRPPGPPLALPFPLPRLLLNRWGVRAFNAGYAAAHPPRDAVLMDLQRFLFPLDGLANWNVAYGRRGILQYQAVLPEDAASAGVAEMLRVARSRPPYLSVLKRMGAGNAGPLSFPIPGYTLAMDFPGSGQAFAVARELDAVVLDHGGRVYLAKDARLQPAALRAMYPRVPAFLDVKRSVDPHGVLASSLARRLDLVG